MRAGLSVPALGLALALAGCGGSGEEPKRSPTASAAPKPQVPKMDAPASREPAGGVRLEPIAAGLKEATAIVGWPGNPDRLLATERRGVVRLIDGTRLARRPLLDLRAKVSHEGPEQGLFDVEFAPDFQRSRLIYVQYTDNGDDLRTEEYRVRGDRADPRSARTVLRAEHPTEELPRQPVKGEDLRVHNGGEIEFGPDGMLWIGIGDGGGQGDPAERGQRRDDLMGNLLRIDPRERPYGVPEDNPFVGRRGVRPEIVAYGLRNPYRFSFHPDTGEVIIGDVGQNSFEEINVLAPDELGANFGWACLEGDEPFVLREKLGVPGRPPCDPSDHVPPVIKRPSSGVAGRCASIIGGHVVRDPALEPLRGRYVYADFCESRLRSARIRDGRAEDDREFGMTIPWPGGFGEDADGRLYVVTYFTGEVLRFVAAG